MARTVTWDELRQLSAFEAEKGRAISVYLNLAPSVTPTAGDAQTRLNSLLDEAAKSGGATGEGLTHQQKQGLRSDFDRIRRYFDQEFVRDGAHGLVVFCDSLDGVWTPIPLTAAVPDEVRVDRRLYLAPLASLVGRGDGALVVVVGREQGRFYELRAGRLEEIADISDEQPRRHDQGGWAQARLQRHVDELASEHLRRVADELDRLVRRAHGNLQVVVTSPEDGWAEFSTLLSQSTRTALAGWTQAQAHASPAELLKIATPVLERSRVEKERELLDRWREEAGRNGRAAAGWEDTLRAASDARVDMLLVTNGADRPAWRCPACGRAAAAEGACPLDGTSLEPVAKGLDAAVHQTLTHGGTVWVVEHAEDLQPVEGIGALLRF
jgi:peptide chain release factor subunit 1